MKKFNKNSLLFAVAILFLVVGLCSGSMVRHIADSVMLLFSGSPEAFSEFTASVDVSGDMLRYKGHLLNINSAKELLMGTRVVFKSETTVVKSDSGALLGYIVSTPPAEGATIWSVEKAERLRKAAENNGAEFIYCSVADNTTYETLPDNYPAYNSQISQMTRDQLTESGFLVIDTEREFRDEGLADEEVFFKTDHHWTPKAGFYVSKAICRTLQEHFGFEYDAAQADLANYRIETYENTFCGSLAKQVGRYFVGTKLDDFDFITPSFETNFTEEIPDRGVLRTGSFEDTMLHLEDVIWDYYSGNLYQIYSGGDFRLQKIVNNNKPEGAVFVIIRASYGCVVTPFLAVHAKELHVIDDREGEYPAGNRVDLEEYIDSVKPDYVIWLD